MTFCSPAALNSWTAREQQLSEILFFSLFLIAESQIAPRFHPRTPQRKIVICNFGRCNPTFGLEGELLIFKRSKVTATSHIVKSQCRGIIKKTTYGLYLFPPLYFHWLLCITLGGL